MHCTVFVEILTKHPPFLLQTNFEGSIETTKCFKENLQFYNFPKITNILLIF